VIKIVDVDIDNPPEDPVYQSYTTLVDGETIPNETEPGPQVELEYTTGAAGL
jgi:hypothetical protein